MVSKFHHALQNTHEVPKKVDNNPSLEIKTRRLLSLGMLPRKNQDYRGVTFPNLKRRWVMSSNLRQNWSHQRKHNTPNWPNKFHLGNIVK
jgi:hypothetical protein